MVAQLARWSDGRLMAYHTAVLGEARMVGVSSPVEVALECGSKALQVLASILRRGGSS